MYKESTAPDLSILKLPVIPKPYGKAILTGQHLQLNHPLPSQHENVVKRSLYLLNSSKIIKKITKQCLLCQSNKKLPKTVPQFSSTSLDYFVVSPSMQQDTLVFQIFIFCQLLTKSYFEIANCTIYLKRAGVKEFYIFPIQKVNSCDMLLPLDQGLVWTK